MNNLENLKDLKQRNVVATAGNGIVLKRWFVLKNMELFKNINFSETYFFEKETDKALLFVNEDKSIKQWLPKSVVVYWTLPYDSGTEITSFYAEVEEKNETTI